MSVDLVARIIDLRRHYHLSAGAIAVYLSHRDHVTVSRRQVRRVIRHHLD